MNDAMNTEAGEFQIPVKEILDPSNGKLLSVSTTRMCTWQLVTNFLRHAS